MAMFERSKPKHKSEKATRPPRPIATFQPTPQDVLDGYDSYRLAAHDRVVREANPMPSEKLEGGKHKSVPAQKRSRNTGSVALGVSHLEIPQ